MEEHHPEKKTDTANPSKTFLLSLALAGYDDIFSDFDPRPYSERMLSEDFLHELKRAASNREEDPAMVLLVPKEKRDAAVEKIVLERLKAHIRHNRHRLGEKRKQDRRTGFQMVAAGVVFMMGATFLLTDHPQSLGRSFIVVLLEPAGWFSFWEGLSLIFFYSKEATPDLGFYQKLSSARMTFTDRLPSTKMKA